MKFHLALAGLALISPFFAYANEGQDRSIDPKALERAQKAIAEYEKRKLASPAGRRLGGTPGFEDIEGDICGKTIIRLNNDCGTENPISKMITTPPDLLKFDLVAGTVYTFKIHGLSCALDPASLLMKEGEASPTEARSTYIKKPSVCGDAGETQDPEIVFEVEESGTYFLSTNPYSGYYPGCPEGGWGYETKISCEIGA
jgi:hypothetical protein